jgi:hypothetical protein
MEGGHKAMELVTEDGWVFALTSAHTTIGRSRDNTLIVPNPYVSRCHAELRFDGRQHGIVDLGSQHGSALNGQALLPHQLYVVRPGDVVTLARQVSFAVRESVSQRPPASRIQIPAGIDLEHVVVGFRRYSDQIDLLFAGVGAFIVLIAFFVGWVRASSPFASSLGFGDLIEIELSGLRMLTGFPDLGIQGGPGVLLIPIFALGALVTCVLRRSRASIPTRILVIAQLLLAFLGTAYMFLVLVVPRAQWNALVQETGFPGVVGEKLLSLQPAAGFWLTCLGFLLIVGSGLWAWRGAEAWRVSDRP